MFEGTEMAARRSWDVRPKRSSDGNPLESTYISHEGHGFPPYLEIAKRACQPHGSLCANLVPTDFLDDGEHQPWKYAESAYLHAANE